MIKFKKLPMPVVFMAAKAKDRYRKPMTGMWDWFERECNHGTPVGKYQSPTNESGGNTYVANSIERLFLSLSFAIDRQEPEFLRWRCRRKRGKLETERKKGSLYRRSQIRS